MLKTLQIINYLKSQGLTKDDIMIELAYITANEESNYFDLSENDVVRITKVWNDETLLRGAFLSVDL